MHALHVIWQMASRHKAFAQERAERTRNAETPVIMMMIVKIIAIPKGCIEIKKTIFYHNYRILYCRLRGIIH